jgi:hypothetical protein
MTSATFYCASDSTNFPGAVGLLNSLRLKGHEEELVVLDAGLDQDDRELLDAHVRVVPPAEDVSPFFRKYALPRTEAAVHVIVDADMIITRRLDELIALAATGSVVAFEDNLVRRFRSDWGELLGLGRLEPRPYVNGGLLFVPTEALPLLDAILARESAIDFSQTLYGGGPANAPFLYYDQDLLNAVLAGPASPEVVALAHQLAPHPPFKRLTLVDERRLVCRYPDGTEPYVLHHVLAKPWTAHTRTNIYSSLLRRLLFAADVELQLQPERVPLRLRNSRAAAVARLNSGFRASLREKRVRVGATPTGPEDVGRPRASSRG